MRHGRRGASLLLALVVFLCLVAGAGRAQDPTAPGTHTAARDTYDYGNEVFLPTDFNPVPGVGVRRVEERAVVHYPQDINNGPYPLLIFLHGRHSTVLGTVSGAPAPL